MSFFSRWRTRYVKVKVEKLFYLLSLANQVVYCKRVEKLFYLLSLANQVVYCKRVEKLFYLLSLANQVRTIFAGSVVRLPGKARWNHK